MKLSVVIINYNTPVKTKEAITALVSNEKKLDYEIILIENGSQKEVKSAVVKKFKVKLITNKENLGFAGAVNQGIEKSKGEYILLLNSDTLVKGQAISKLVDYLDENKKTALVGPKMIYPDGKIQPSFGRFPNFWREFIFLSGLYKITPWGRVVGYNFFNRRKFTKAETVDWISGGCMLIRRKFMEQVGKLDDNFFFGFEDIDYCYQARKNDWQVAYQPLAEVVHYHSFSVKSTDKVKFEKQGINYFLKKNFPNKYLSRVFIGTVYWFKAFLRI